MMPYDLAGQKFGKLLAVSVSQTASGTRGWLCQCDCGQTTVAETSNLRAGRSTACGKCRVGRKGIPAGHGHATNGYSPTWISWRSMRIRCTNENRDNAKTYALAGISFDPRWADFSAFLSDMGERPEGKTLDRIDNEKGYYKANCQWATPTQQTRNRRIAKLHTQGGRTMPIAEWAKEIGVNYYTAYARIRRHGELRA